MDSDMTTSQSKMINIIVNAKFHNNTNLITALINDYALLFLPDNVYCGDLWLKYLTAHDNFIRKLFDNKYKIGRIPNFGEVQ